MPLNEVAKASIEEAFKDSVKAGFVTLCSNLAGKAAPEPDCFGMFLKDLELLKKARAQALLIADKVLSGVASTTQ